MVLDPFRALRRDLAVQPPFPVVDVGADSLVPDLYGFQPLILVILIAHLLAVPIGGLGQLPVVCQVLVGEQGLPSRRDADAVSKAVIIQKAIPLTEISLPN